jgi:hypothetical protein
VRVFIFLAVVFWLLSIWGAAHSLCRTADPGDLQYPDYAGPCSHFLAGGQPLCRAQAPGGPAGESGDKDEDKIDEWGLAASLARSHTLLPMLRKFIGSVLVTMVIMIALSSLGVNIAPLLDGAGVVGLAVGFGARKLVTDIFIRVFFLMDDAIRVGEYLKSGTVTGVVEKITLRNVFLRHHRGMLQIVPYGDLGAITNFMGGAWWKNSTCNCRMTRTSTRCAGSSKRSVKK